MEEIKFKKGKLFLYHGWLYQNDITRLNGTKGFRCRSHKKHGCLVRLIQDHQGIRRIKPNMNHNHPDHSIDVVELKALASMKKLATEKPTEGLKKLYHEEYQRKLDETVAAGFNREESVAILPDYIQSHSMMQRGRQEVIPIQSKQTNELQLSSRWTTVEVKEGGTRFLLVDDGSEDKILIFCTDRFLQILCRSKKIFDDGTFFTCPLLFSQIYTIHGMIRDKMVPLVYCLLPKKDIRTYRRMIRSIQDAAADRHPELPFIPTEVQMDYEMAMISTLRQLFPEVSGAPGIVIHGCHFHFCQCILR